MLNTSLCHLDDIAVFDQYNTDEWRSQTALGNYN